MTLYSQVILSRDLDFESRVAAAAARVSVMLGPTVDPSLWAKEHVLKISGSPGFAEAYWYAMENNVENPGRDTSVITDDSLEAAVQVEIRRWRGLVTFKIDEPYDASESKEVLK
jgi:hypothetical protein